MDILLFLGALSILIWLGILFHPARPWDFQPVGEDTPLSFESGEPAKADRWPSVCVLVPARNEAEALANTLPALLTQEYPGQLTIIVVDDRSEDGTGERARRISQEFRMEHRLTVLSGAGLPQDWVGKVWALEQAAAVCGVESPEAVLVHKHGERERLPTPHYLLLTDADILHAPRSVWRLVAESQQHGLGLNSRMARLRCVSAAEQLLIPAFVFFFNLLYPMRWVNKSSSRMPVQVCPLLL